MDTKESRTGRTGQGNVSSGRSSPGSKLKTEESAKKASGKKLQGEKASQAAAGEKLRFDKAVFSDEAVDGARAATSHGRKTPKKSHASTLISDSVHQKIDHDADDNAGTDALNRGSQFAEHTAENGSNAFSGAASLPSTRQKTDPMHSLSGVRKARSKRSTQPQRQEKAPVLQRPAQLPAVLQPRRMPEKRQRKQRRCRNGSVSSCPSIGTAC